jgi:hypothetical protein
MGEIEPQSGGHTKQKSEIDKTAAEKISLYHNE